MYNYPFIIQQFVLDLCGMKKYESMKCVVKVTLNMYTFYCLGYCEHVYSTVYSKIVTAGSSCFPFLPVLWDYDKQTHNIVETYPWPAWWPAAWCVATLHLSTTTMGQYAATPAGGIQYTVYNYDTNICYLPGHSSGVV